MSKISLLPISCLNFSLSFIHFFAEPFSLLAWRSQLSVHGVCGDFLSLNECTTVRSRSLFPFDCELKIVGTTFPGCHYDCQPTRDLATVSRGLHLKILTLWEPCLLRFACCCWMLLNAGNLLDLLWWKLWWRRHGTGNFGDCQGD